MLTSEDRDVRGMAPEGLVGMWRTAISQVLRAIKDAIVHPAERWDDFGEADSGEYEIAAAVDRTTRERAYRYKRGFCGIRRIKESKEFPCPAGKTLQALRALLFLGTSLASTNPTHGMDVVAKGEPQAIIVTSDSPSLVVQYAAKELQSHIQLASGARLEVIPERDAAASSLKNRVYIGPCQASEKAGIEVDDLPLNGFHNKVTEDAVFLAGRDNGGMPKDTGTKAYAKAFSGFVNGAPPLDDSASMGSLFAVYDWLENQAGVKWLWPGESGTVVPATKNLSGGPVDDQIVIRPLIHARPRLDFTRWAGTTEANRNKYIYETCVWLRRQRFSRSESFEYPHAYEHYWERFGSAHPGYFALRPDGKREPHSEKTPHLVQMCVSNADLHKQIIADWLVQRSEQPSIPWIDGAENDKAIQDPSCTCAACRAWDPPDAPPIKNQAERKAAINDTSNKPLVSLSDRYARFWLALQAEGKKHDPEARVIAYAYADYGAPPVATKLNDHIILGIVPPYAFPVDEKEKDAFRKLWDGWTKTGARLYLRPNYFLTGYCTPYIFADQFGEEYKYAATHGMIATDFDSLLGMWGVQGLNLYVLGRLNVNPDLSVSSILNDYYSGFGPASQEIRDYFNYWKGVTMKCDTAFRTNSKGGWDSVSKSGDQVYTSETFQVGRQFLEKAKTVVAADDTAALHRIDYLSIWLEHAELAMKTLAAYHASRYKPTDAQLKTALVQNQKALDEFRAAHEDEIGNVGILRKVEMWCGWRRPDPKPPELP
jgi:hypothetical protein